MPTTVPARRVEDLSYLLAHTSHVLATQMSVAMASIGITPRAYCVLFHAMQAERTQIQLAEIADLDKTTMVVTVDELERAGLAERRPSGTDRRARIIAVTDAGRKVVAEGTRIADGVHRAVLDALPGAERDVLVSALSRLAAGYLAMPAGSDRPVRRARQRSAGPG
jgi:MarR family transcriptional regulator, transcriptional regulator for hemolysin